MSQSFSREVIEKNPAFQYLWGYQLSYNQMFWYSSFKFCSLCVTSLSAQSVECLMWAPRSVARTARTAARCGALTLYTPGYKGCKVGRLIAHHSQLRSRASLQNSGEELHFIVKTQVIYIEENGNLSHVNAKSWNLVWINKKMSIYQFSVLLYIFTVNSFKG